MCENAREYQRARMFLCAATIIYICIYYTICLYILYIYTRMVYTMSA